VTFKYEKDIKIPQNKKQFFISDPVNVLK